MVLKYSLNAKFPKDGDVCICPVGSLGRATPGERTMYPRGSKAWQEDRLAEETARKSVYVIGVKRGQSVGGEASIEFLVK